MFKYRTAPRDHLSRGPNLGKAIDFDGLTVAQRTILASLESFSGPVVTFEPGLQQIANRARLWPIAASSALNSLVKRGLVRKRLHADEKFRYSVNY